MASIGLDNLFYETIAESASGVETYGSPVRLAKAMTAELSVEINEATLWADDGAAETVKEFKNGTISLGVDAIGAAVAAALTGAGIDDNGVLVSAGENIAPPVAIGFRAQKSKGTYMLYWLYRVVFGVPGTKLTTKGDGITFSTPTIEGTIYRRNKLDSFGKHPWKTEVDESDANVSQAVLTDWFNHVYEPEGTASHGFSLAVSKLPSPTLQNIVTNNAKVDHVAMDGNVITITAAVADLAAFTDAAVGSGSHKWVGIEVTTGLASILGISKSGVPFVEADVVSAVQQGSSSGDFVLYVPADAPATRNFSLTKPGYNEASVTIAVTAP